jgi:probable F420-dependent oxidoreductase
MKIRIGLGLGAANDLADGDTLGHVVDELERLGFDSLWFTERINGPSLDPLIAMTFTIARTRKLKVGTSVMVLPGRNPVVLAKAIASLDRLSDGRAFPAVGLGAVNPLEQQAFGVERKERAPWFDEALPLMRRLWSEDNVIHHGARFHLDGITVEPKPRRKHVDIWLGGAATVELERCGRLGDGWLPSFCTPQSVHAGIATVNEAAERAGRAVDQEHFGVLLPYIKGPLPPGIVDVIRKREPNAAPEDIVARDHRQLCGMIEQFITAGASKFVVMPYGSPAAGWTEELEQLATLLLPLQN